MEHEPLTLGNAVGVLAAGAAARAAPGQPTYQASPRVRSVEVSALGGTVGAEHAETAGARSSGRSDGTPGQTFPVDRSPVLPRRDGETSGSSTATQATAGQEVDDFSALRPTDRHYVWDSGTGVVHFGPRIRYPDGSIRQHGAIPRDGALIEVAGLPARRRIARQRRRAHAHRDADRRCRSSTA